MIPSGVNSSCASSTVQLLLLTVCEQYCQKISKVFTKFQNGTPKNLNKTVLSFTVLYLVFAEVGVYKFQDI